MRPNSQSRRWGPSGAPVSVTLGEVVVVIALDAFREDAGAISKKSTFTPARGSHYIQSMSV